MSDFRKNPAAALPGQIIAGVDDYIGGLNGLPKSNVLKFRFGDESWLAVRPSGTEPKIKFYFGAAGRSRADVAARLHEIERIVRAGVRELG
jgi:phosphoglucomutase